ncbi:Stage II sporulation protein E (SpoIIE) [Mycolicibacterium rhodesiae NBB3]|uniref:Stage II sporulation protein E (SpoIIE) n=1 Tax=Mycolicibacterium rhodesiae (strain NBB3) TaxID=710685 RepID=G8RK43_MYCRN|nr:SpoIIE family protein phosphatase [Mycolicibacterium rhodesiae]AEV72268.1 Stage II sporulation protein E (SpoIIE) [Mycolicibacterium rhodesiae NBB3]
MFRHGRFGPIEWAAVRRPRPGEHVCGDHPIALEVGDGAALFGVIDGLGHGEAAAEAAQRAAEVIEENRAAPLDVMMTRCHLELTETRGVAMTLARVDFRADALRWIGVGNVTADLVAKHPAGVAVRSSALLAAGIVGYRMPQTLSTNQVPITPGDLLIISSDGIDEHHLDSIDFAAHATTIAEQLVGRHGRETDDALVLAARHRGIS